MRFAIPLKREDLAKPAEEDGLYWVRSVLSVRELVTRMKDCELGVRQTGSAFVLDGGGFDVLYSVLAHLHKEAGAECKGAAFAVLEKGLAALEKELDRVLAGEMQKLPADEKESWLNRTKMLVYLMCQLMELLEAQDTSSSVVPAAGRGRGKKAAAVVSSGGWDWSMERKLAAVTLLYKLVNLNLALLFDPPVVEEDFVNVIATALFRLLENPSVALQKGKDLRLSICQLLGILCSRFGYSLSCRLKIVQSLRHFEHLSTAMSEAVQMFSRDYGCTSMVMEIVRDISQVPTQELARDTSGTRAYAGFLSDLAERMPEKMKPCLSLLMLHLDGESSTMRKAVLSILGEIVLRVLRGDELDETAKDTRDQFLDCLEDHVHDVHAHVWTKLCQNKTIPLNRQHRLLRLVIGRLQDKSSNVRKQAVQLLTTLLQCNPFTANMTVDDLRAELSKEQERLKELQPPEEEDQAAKAQQREEEWARIEEALKATEEDGEDDVVEDVWENAAEAEVVGRLQHLLQKKKYARAIALLTSAKEAFPEHAIFGADIDKQDALKAAFLAHDEARQEEENLLSQQSQNPGEKTEYEKQKVIVSYLADSVMFAEELNTALPTICMLLGSKQVSDILEAVTFFVSAFEFGFVQAMVGVRQMLNLVWSQEATVKDAVVSAYKRLYIETNGSSAAATARSIARNFMALVSGATVGELASLEELVCMLVTSEDMTKEVFQVLWQYFTKHGSEEISDEDSRAALVLLGMVASARPEVVTSNISLLIQVGLTERGRSDLLLAHDTCVALSKIAAVKKGVKEAPTKLDSDHELFSSLRRIMVEGIKDKESNFYIPAAQKALVVAYQFAEQPDVMCGDWLKEICREILEDQGVDEDDDDSVERTCSVDSLLTRRLVSVVGHLAVCQLNHLDVAILGELKRRKALRDLKKEAKQSSKSKRRKSSMGAKRQGTGEDDEMDCIGAEADDTEMEFIRNVCETEIVNSTNLLAAFTPLVIHICSNPNKYRDSSLRIAASLSLAKLMLVSSSFCDEHLQLLFTLLEKSEEDALRANLIVAAGDLSFRFPNILEPWTPNMYGRLRDQSALVRSNTLTVLTHLILNDMIKVKGQISDMALCIADRLDKISGLAKHFFSELARKGNALYNVMPDIISRLSSEDAKEEVTEETFQLVMGHIVSLIEKDKHLESLVEKLCHRFRACPDSPRQWRDLSYCLSLFSFNDKAIKKLQDNFACFSDKLHDEAVYNAFTGILVQSRKNLRNETKVVVDELEEALEKAHLKCLEDHKANTRAEAARGGKRKSKGTSAKKSRRGASTSDDDEDDEDDKAELTLKLEEEAEDEDKGGEGEEEGDEEEDASPEEKEEAEKDTEEEGEEEFEEPAKSPLRPERSSRKKKAEKVGQQEEASSPPSASPSAKRKTQRCPQAPKSAGGRRGRRRIEDTEEEEEETEEEPPARKRATRRRK